MKLRKREYEEGLGAGALEVNSSSLKDADLEAKDSFRAVYTVGARVELGRYTDPRKHVVSYPPPAPPSSVRLCQPFTPLSATRATSTPPPMLAMSMDRK